VLTKFLERFRIEHKLIPSSDGKELLAQLSNSSHLRQLWVLVSANIIAIGCMGGVLVLMSSETAYLVLSVAMTFCAAAVVTVSGYTCWYLVNLNRQVSHVLEGVNGLNQGIILTDKRGYIQYYNNKVHESFGELDDMPLDEFTEAHVHPDGVTNFLKLRKAARAHQASAGTILVGKSEASPEMWRVRVLPLAVGSGYVFWIFEPHDSESSEEETSPEFPQAFSNFRSIFEQAPMGIVLLDQDSKIRASNRFFREELFQSKLEPQQSFYDLLHPNCRQEAIDCLEKIKSGENIVVPLEIQFLADKSAQISAFASRIDNKNQTDPDRLHTSGVILHFFDNSQQKLLHLQLAQSQKMQAMGQLAGGIAHDFNNLLTAIIGFCDLLLLRHSPGDQSFTDIMQIKQNSNRAANLVRQLLAFSKQQTLQPQMLNVSENLSEVSVLLQRLVGVNVTLSIVHGRDLGVIKVDKGQFEQVIINLVVNARDAMDEKGTITVKTYNQNFAEDFHRHHDLIPAGNYVLIEVDDTGCGISKENMSRIFDPFFSTKELGRGTGLGLSTVYGIVKQTGGYIIVDSEVNKGTKFKVLFPYYDPALLSAEIDKSKKQEFSSDLTGSGSILLVEDEDAVRLFGSRALRDKGYRVVEARDGLEALNYLESMVDSTESKIDLLITDVVMPVMDGVELVKRVHEILPHLPIIYISGYAEDSFRQKVGEEDNIHFLPKPFSLKELARKVKDVMPDHGKVKKPDRSTA
jgi:two-component system cell cycle sensor histidine kinase/response regulator CckA